MDATLSHAYDQPQVSDLKETCTMWVSKAHYRLLTEHVAEARNDFNAQAKQFADTISAQRASIQHLESDRRELVRLLLDREERRTAAPIAVPDAAPPDNWEAIMRKQIDEQDDGN